VILHRLAGDPIELLVEGGPATSLEVGPRHFVLLLSRKRSLSGVPG
jgi:hypothetical protein